MNVSAKTPVMEDFSYDPFDLAVMADPLPYYRVLREHYPLYYMPKWDTFALSRFADIWDVLSLNDGTFVASEGTLPPATVLARHNWGQVADPPWHPLPFHAVAGVPLDRRRMLDRANAFAAEHPVLLSAYLTHIFGLDDVQAAFELACRPEPERVKIAIAE